MLRIAAFIVLLISFSITSLASADIVSDMGSAAVTNVNAGTLDGVTTGGGTWAVDFVAVDTNSIVGNGTGIGFATGATDFALLVDQGGQSGTAQGAGATLTLGTDVDFTSPVDVEFDMAYSRSGNNKSLSMIGYGADDTTEVFRFDWLLAGSSPLTGIGDPTDLALGNLNTFANSANAYDPSLMSTFNVTLDGTTLTYGASGLTPQSTTILNSGTELSSIEWLITGSSTGNQGFWLDNVSVATAVPEPNTFLLLGLSFTGAMLRRRRS